MHDFRVISQLHYGTGFLVHIANDQTPITHFQPMVLQILLYYSFKRYELLVFIVDEDIK